MAVTFSRWSSSVALFTALALWTAPATADEPIHIQPLGDSITTGYVGTGVPYGFGYRSGLYTQMNNANYPFQFVGNSQEPWDNKFGWLPDTVLSPDLRTVNQDGNRGYGARTADHLAPNINDWLTADSPDVVLLMVGINSIDQGSNVTPTAAQNSLKALVQRIVVARPTAHVIVAQITPYAQYTGSIVQYNNYIKTTLVPYFTSLGKNVSTVDQYSNIAPGGVIDTSLFSNGINHPNATGYNKMATTWLNGIQSLGTLTHAAGAALPVLGNGDFEAEQYTSQSHNTNPTGASWSFSTSSAGPGSGIDYGNPCGASNATVANGSQVGFLQGAGAGTNQVTSMSQTMKGLIVGRTYTLSFSAKGIAGIGLGGAVPFSVSVNNSTLTVGGSSVLSPGTSAYTTYNTTFVASSSSMSLKFSDAGNLAINKLTWIDNVKLGISTPAVSNLVTNGTFETGSFGANTHNNNPSGTGWTFTAAHIGGAATGIDRGNLYGCPNAPAYQGSQNAFLQGAGEGNGVNSISQSVSGFQVGKEYKLTFEAAGIEGYSLGFGGADPFSVSVGGNVLTFGGGSSWLSPSYSYGLYCSDTFIATDPTMTLRFFDGGNVPVTYATFLDDVQITQVPEPGTLVLLIGAAAMGIACWFRRKS